MKLELNVKKVDIILRKGGTDLIVLVLNDRTAFPSEKYQTCAKIETQQGEAIDWCRRFIPGVPPNIIRGS